MDRASKIKLVALDMDGTVLNSQKQVGPRTRQVLKRLSDKGVYIVVATGRPPQGIFNYVKDLSLVSDRGYVVCFNGAGIVSLPHVNFVYNEYLNGTTVMDLARITHEHGCKIHAFSVQQGLILEDENSPSYREVQHCKVGYKKSNLEHVDANEHFFKALAVGQSHELDALRASLDAMHSDKYTIMRSDPNFLEFIPGRCTKGSALTHLCEILNISMDNVLAFGDAENDADMLKKAGIGVAMGNADDTVKALADFVTLDNDNEGIAVFLEKLFELS